MKILIVIPVITKRKLLTKLATIVNFCQNNLIDGWQIVVADNASTDKTAVIVQEIADNEPRLFYFQLNQKGKGLAVISAWRQFSADIYCFMDADLAVDLIALPELIKAIKDGADVALGSRRLPGSKVKRRLLKKIISWHYNFLARAMLKSKISDHPCGFKAVNQKVIKEILPKIKNQQWFFDTELLILAERAGYRIKEISVNWTEPIGRQSRTPTLKLSFDYLREVWRLKQALPHIAVRGGGKQITNHKTGNGPGGQNNAQADS